MQLSPGIITDFTVEIVGKM